jgi:hypothetical protein
MRLRTVLAFPSLISGIIIKSRPAPGIRHNSQGLDMLLSVAKRADLKRVRRALTYAHRSVSTNVGTVLDVMAFVELAHLTRGEVAPSARSSSYNRAITIKYCHKKMFLENVVSLGI